MELPMVNFQLHLKGDVDCRVILASLALYNNKKQHADRHANRERIMHFHSDNLMQKPIWSP